MDKVDAANEAKYLLENSNYDIKGLDIPRIEMCPLMDVAKEEMKIFSKGKYKDDGTLDWYGLIYTKCKNINIFLAMTLMATHNFLRI